MNTAAIEQLFKAMDLVIFHLTRKKEYQQIMTAYGLTPKRVQEGDGLLKNARQLHSVQDAHYDTASDMSLQMEEECAAALDVFKGHVAIAKSAFRKEPQVLKKLKINKLAKGKWALVQQAVNFYEKTPQYAAQLQQFGGSPEDFAQNKSAVEAVLTLQALRLDKKADAEGCTQQKNEAVKELRAWYGEFRKLARIAFKKNPQALESFGIVVLSGPKKRKPKAEVTPVGEGEGSSEI